MKLRFVIFIVNVVIFLVFFSCSNKEETPISSPYPNLIVKFKFDSNQIRLNNLGQPASVGAGNAAQSPVFNTISSHYLEFAPNANTQLGQGTILYHAPETNAGGTNAIDFSKSKIVTEGETFLSIPIKDIAPGSYQWVRCSLSYQNYKINVLSSGVELPGTLASFVGFRTFIGTHTIGAYSFSVNANRDQGYWAFGLNTVNYSTSGQAPAGATTVPNPLASTSPIPAGSCVVTGKFVNDLVITGRETGDIVVTLSLSVNKSFEWHEVTTDGKYEPSIGENVVDMGLRGLIPSYVK